MCCVVDGCRRGAGCQCRAISTLSISFRRGASDAMCCNTADRGARAVGGQYRLVLRLFGAAQRFPRTASALSTSSSSYLALTARCRMAGSLLRTARPVSRRILRPAFTTSSGRGSTKSTRSRLYHRGRADRCRGGAGWCAAHRWARARAVRGPRCVPVRAEVPEQRRRTRAADDRGFPPVPTGSIRRCLNVAAPVLEIEDNMVGIVTTRGQAARHGRDRGQGSRRPQHVSGRTGVHRRGRKQGLAEQVILAGRYFLESALCDG